MSRPVPEPDGIERAWDDSFTARAAAGSATGGRIARLRESPPAMIGLGIVLFWVVLAIFAPLIAPYDPNFQDIAAIADPTPSTSHWLGTDEIGRDVLSRIIWGARRVLTVVPVAVLVAYVLGCAIGLVSGYLGGIVDDVIQRTSDMVLAFPLIILYILMISTWGPTVFNIIVAIALASSPRIGRIARGLVLELREREYVTAAQVRGESSLFIMVVEILPNARGPLIADMCLRLGYTTLAIGSLGFLGLGLPPPEPEWGGMVSKAITMLNIFPHMALFPCIAISSLVIGFNMLADGLHEIGQRD